VEELQLVTDNYDEFGGLILSEWTSLKVMTAFILVEFVLIWSELAHFLFGFLTCFFGSFSLHSHGCLFLLFWLHIHLSQHQGKPSMLVEIAVHTFTTFVFWSALSVLVSCLIVLFARLHFHVICQQFSVLVPVSNKLVMSISVHDELLIQSCSQRYIWLCFVLDSRFEEWSIPK
jgi:hypothetical protein